MESVMNPARRFSHTRCAGQAEQAAWVAGRRLAGGASLAECRLRRHTMLLIAPAVGRASGRARLPTAPLEEGLTYVGLAVHAMAARLQSLPDAQGACPAPIDQILMGCTTGAGGI